MNTPRYRDAKELFEFAVSFNTDELYSAVGKPHPAKALANTVGPYIAGKANEKGIGGEDLKISADDGTVYQILWWGVHDTQRILVPHLKLQPTIEQAHEFIHDPKTALTMAQLALRSEGAFEGIASEMESGAYVPKESAPYLAIPQQLHLSNNQNGCPAARHIPNQHESLNSTWRKLVPWVGRLALNGLIEHHEIYKPAFIPRG